MDYRRKDPAIVGEQADTFIFAAGLPASRRALPANASDIALHKDSNHVDRCSNTSISQAPVVALFHLPEADKGLGRDKPALGKSTKSYPQSTTTPLVRHYGHDTNVRRAKAPCHVRGIDEYRHGNRPADPTVGHDGDLGH